MELGGTALPAQACVHQLRSSTSSTEEGFSFLLFKTAPAAYGSSQARGRTGATAAGLHHSHSNLLSELCVSRAAIHNNARPLTHRVRPGIKPMSSWILVRFVTAKSQQELPPLRVFMQVSLVGMMDETTDH